MNYNIDYLCVNILQKIYTFHNQSMTIGDIAPKINSPQAETHSELILKQLRNSHNIPQGHKYQKVGLIKNYAH